MNAVEILGSLLGGKSRSSGSGSGSRSGSGGKLLKDFVAGVLKKRSQAQGQGQASSPRPSGRSVGGNLQDMLRDAYSNFQKRQGGSQDPDCNDPSHRDLGTSGASELNNEQAVVLIRAMVNAAKSDGQLDRQEQDAIVKRLGDVTQEEVQFLKNEFAAPLDVREFAWSVPLGLEQQVYELSLMAIDLDQKKEARYLQDLARGLRLGPDACNRIHRQYNAPLLYK